MNATILRALLALSVSTGAAAQTPDPAAHGPAVITGSSRERPASLEELSRVVGLLQQRVDQQDAEIAELRRLLSPGAASRSSAEPHTAPVTTPAAQAPDNQKPARLHELPPDVVSAGDFPGSFNIPGTDAALKIGGLVRVNWVSTNDALTVQDRFVTSAIPVDRSDDANRGSLVDVIASPSRFNFDLRTPTGVGHMRAFIEGDFAGSNGTLRLRHAYGQWKRAIFGQTWSTFSDPEAEPDGIDFEGLNAIVLFRQPQIRWSFAPKERMRLAVALEDPRAELTGANPVSEIPDFITRLRYDWQRGGHLQVAAVFRGLRGNPADEPSNVVGTFGFGANVSGRLPSPFFSPRDQVLFQSNAGTGIGHYITDLSSAGGQDAVFDPVTNRMETLDAVLWIHRIRALVDGATPVLVQLWHRERTEPGHSARRCASLDATLLGELHVVAGSPRGFGDGAPLREPHEQEPPARLSRPDADREYLPLLADANPIHMGPSSKVFRSG